MPKKKRSQKHSDRIENPSRRPDKGSWSDLERAFFAAAPPDQPGPAVEPECFDDLQAAGPSRPELPAGLQRLLNAATRLVGVLSAPRLSLRNVTIAIASLVLLIGLSAVVFASHRRQYKAFNADIAASMFAARRTTLAAHPLSRGR